MLFEWEPETEHRVDCDTLSAFSSLGLRITYAFSCDGSCMWGSATDHRFLDDCSLVGL